MVRDNANRYIRLRELDAGSFGTVYAVRRRTDGAEFAAKFLQADWDPQARRRFQDEGARQIRAEGPGVVQVFDWDFEGTTPFIVMALMTGSLKDRIQKIGTWPCCCAVRAMADASSALASIHERGLVHHDFKPQNLLYDANDRLLLSDFGCAVTCHVSDFGCGAAPCYTEAYAAPEHAQGAGQKADVYALGVIFYELLMGCPLPPRWWTQALRWPSQSRGCATTHRFDDTIRRLAAQDPRHRPTARQAADYFSSVHAAMMSHQAALPAAAPPPAPRTGAGDAWRGHGDRDVGKRPTKIIGPVRTAGSLWSARPMSSIGTPFLPWFVRQLERTGLAEIAGGAAALEAGLQELQQGLLVVAAELVNGERLSRDLCDMVGEPELFPHTCRMHGLLADTLEMAVPEELARWARRLAAMAPPPEAPEIRRALAAFAATSGNPFHRALARFLLFEWLCVRQRLALRRDGVQLQALNGSHRDIEVLAWREVAILPTLAGSGIGCLEVEEPLSLLEQAVMGCLDSHIQTLKRELAHLSREVHDGLARRKAILAAAARVEPADAILILNETADEFGEERLTAEQLRRSHPLLLGGVSDDALYKRVERLPKRVANGTKEKAKTLADILIDIMEAAS
jgi:serine/threonine-protein kinase